MSYFGGWRPYVSAGERRRRAAREMAKLRKTGHPLSPVAIEGRTIARTFWGKAWCENLERYSDYSNRLPRGRTYVRNGSVLDLQMAPGEVKALVSGSEIYHVAVNVARVPKARWTSIARDCAGAIDSLVELLQGRFSKGVMERICQQKTGLFPAPAEIEFSCSCPDWASMCKHVAAVLYGIGARLDEQPELLFKLRQVDENDLIAKAGRDLPLSRKGPAAEKILGPARLSEIFGLDIAATAEELPSAGRKTPASAKKQAPPSAKKQAPASAKKQAPASAKKQAPASAKKQAPASAKKQAPPSAKKQAPAGPRVRARRVGKPATKAKPAAKGKAATTKGKAAAAGPGPARR